MSNPTLKTFLFAGLLCLGCSLLLTAAATGLKGLQERNVAVDRHRNILEAVGAVGPDSRPAAEKIESLFAASIRTLWVDTAGRIVSGKERAASDLPLSFYEK